MSDYSDRLRATLEDVKAELLETGDGDWLPGTSRAHGMLDVVLAEQNPNAIEVEIVVKDGGRYDVRCHGANGIATIYDRLSLADALRALEDWCASQARSLESSIA